MRSNNNPLIVDARHNGPPGSGNGGWTAGLIAARLGAPVAEVTLRRPPLVGTPFEVTTTDDGLRVTDAEGAVIATAQRRVADIPAVPCVPRDEAAAAVDRYPGHGQHHFPTCFVCGPQRDDGLRVFPGRVGEGRTAAIFVAPDDVDDVTVWAALDCPGGWTVIEGDAPWVLGRFAVAVDRLPEPGQECVAVGEAVHREGRKALVRTSLYSTECEVLARGEATWIRLAL